MVRRSRRREAAERWRTRAADAYGQARLIDALLARDPVDSPDLRGRIAAARSEFFSLAALGPDLPSMQGASMASSALDELDLALNAESAPPSQPGVAEPDQLTVGQARDRVNHALELLRPLLGTIGPDGPGGETP
jgi:hypothetical protein